MNQKQQEEMLVKAGWGIWQQEMPDGRKVPTSFWKYQGARQWYFNENGQTEYANSERRYTLAEAVRVQQLVEETEPILERRRAESAQKQGISGQAPAAKGVRVSDGMSVAEQAAREAEAAEAPA